jgi:predicted cupin superfamily sugar epimerase
MSQPAVGDIIEHLGLVPLPDEGGLWAQSWRDQHSSAIYFLLRPGDFSALHRLRHVELWHFYAGAPVQLLLLNPDASGGADAGQAVTRPQLGMDLLADQRPCQPVPAGVWMGANTMGEWSLVGTTVAPPYEPAIFELGSRSVLARQFPEARAEIEALTRAAESPSGLSGH